MAHFFEQGREEVTSLLECGNEEFNNGDPLVALSMLFEAQFALNEMVQNAMEKAVQPPSWRSGIGIGMSSSKSNMVH